MGCDEARFALGPFCVADAFAVNFIGAEGGASVGRSLTALTALQTLDLFGKNLCSERVCGVCFVMREWVVTRQGLRLGPFVSMIRVAGNSLNAEDGASVGRSLTALTALQTLNLSGKNLCSERVCGVLCGRVFCYA